MPKVDPTPDGRDVSIGQRQARLRNLNSKPESHGTEKLPRHDLSLEFTLPASQADAVIDFEGEIENLWNKDGAPRFREITDRIALDFKAVGVAKLGPVRGDVVEFDATLKKVSVLFTPEKKLLVHAQLRIDPTDHTEWLTQAQCAGAIKFGFKGKVLIKGAGDEDDDNEQLPLTQTNGAGEQPAAH